MLDLTLDSLKSYLLQNKLEAKLQPDTNQLYLLFKVEDKDYPLFIRIYEEGDALQLLAFLPSPFKQTAAADTARFLHVINKELDIPGFGLDEANNVIFYRIILPCFQRKINESELSAYINSVQLVCQTFTPLITPVAAGLATYDETRSV